jgi:hypothetical protein
LLKFRPSEEEFEDTKGVIRIRISKKRIISVGILVVYYIVIDILELVSIKISGMRGHAGVLEPFPPPSNAPPTGLPHSY